MFKSYSPLPASPPGCAGNEVEGGRNTLNSERNLWGGRESSSSAAAWSKHFQRRSLIEKVCFISLRWASAREERGKKLVPWAEVMRRPSDPPYRRSAGREQRVWVKHREEVRERQSFSADECNQGWPPSWLLRGQTVHNINPSYRLPTAVSSFPTPLPHRQWTCKCSGSFLCWHHVGTGRRVNSVCLY